MFLLSQLFCASIFTSNEAIPLPDGNLWGPAPVLVIPLPDGSLWDSVTIISETSAVQDQTHSQEHQNQQEDDAPSCAICLEGFDDDQETAFGPCGSTQHPFHRLCIATWLRRSDACPVCRSTGASSSSTELNDMSDIGDELVRVRDEIRERRGRERDLIGDQMDRTEEHFDIMHENLEADLEEIGAQFEARLEQLESEKDKDIEELESLIEAREAETDDTEEALRMIDSDDEEARRNSGREIRLLKQNFMREKHEICAQIRVRKDEFHRMSRDLRNRQKSENSGIQHNQRMARQERNTLLREARLSQSESRQGESHEIREARSRFNHPQRR